jgi:Ca2+-binding RTX toxin-like protein
MSAVQNLTLKGGGGNDYYTLNSSGMPAAIIATGGYNTLDFSHDTAGVTVNLGLDKGQAQSIAPWGTTLSIYGAINKLIGTAYADVLTGGPAATTEIVGGLGNDTLTGGSGNNILLGGGGNDTIVGGGGTNLIIAGSGTCSLYADGSQNIVFAGSTNYDTNDQALLNLLEEGPRFMYSYSYRRALASVARNPALLSSMLSFQDSGAHDTIFGSGGNNLFLLGKYGTLKG